MDFNFCGGAYESRSQTANIQSCVNLYPEVEGPAGKSKVVLYGTPGLSLFSTLPTSPLRGIWIGQDRCFAVAGSKLYEVFSGGTYDELGDVGDDGDHSPVQMFPNGNQLMILSAGNVYIDSGSGPQRPEYIIGTNTVDIDGVDVTWASGDKFTSDMVGKKIVFWTESSPGVWQEWHNTVYSVTDDEHLVLTAPGSEAPLTGVPTDARGYVLGTQGAFLDGFFVVMKGGGYRTFYHSALYDGTSWDGLDWAEKEGYPDALMAMLADHEDLWLFGSQTTEVWRNNYSTKPEDFPWERDPGAFIHFGCLAPWSVARYLNSVVWLSGDPRGNVFAVRAQGYIPQRISTPAVEAEWNTYADPQDAEAFSYTDAGHDFYVINFPAANKTWVFDAQSAMWHERGYWNGSSNDRIRARCHGFVWGKHLVGDHSTGAIYEMSLTSYTDNGTAIHWERTAPHIAEEGHRLFYHRLRLDMEKATGLTVTLEMSNDGGQNWSAAANPSGPEVSHGYTSRIVSQAWRRLGSGRDRVFRVKGTASSRVALVNAYLELTPGK